MLEPIHNRQGGVKLFLKVIGDTLRLSCNFFVLFIKNKITNSFKVDLKGEKKCGI